MPFLQFDNAIGQVIYTTNAIESVNARIRRAVKARGHFPTEAAALKCVYLAIMSLDPTGTARQRWSNRWKAALNAFEITFDGRLSAGRNQPESTTERSHRPANVVLGQAVELPQHGFAGIAQVAVQVRLDFGVGHIEHCARGT